MNTASTNTIESGSAGLVATVARAGSLLSRILTDQPEVKPAVRAASNAELRLEVLRDREGMERLASHWDHLLSKSAVRTPFMSWDWAEIWWKHFESDYKAIFGVAWSEDGRLVALVPFIVGPGQTSTRKHLRELAYFGGLGEVVSEGLDCIALPGHEALLSRLMCLVFESIRGEWDTAFFGFADQSSPYFRTLHQALQKYGIGDELTNRQASPIIHLGDKAWDSYLMERSGNFRKKFRRISAAATADFQMTFREPAGEDDVNQFVDELLDLHGGRWTEEQSLFLRPRARSFHHELAKRWVTNRRVVLLVMDFLGEPVAANYAFVEGDKMWDYQGGWKLEHVELSPAKLLNAENIRRAIAHGIKEIDMLPGDLEYKSKWTGEVREVLDLVAFNPQSVRARVFQSIRTVKRVIEKVFPGGATES
jgi:CelD/BcsL family acetyltransferase involved in cellulose biosynthesis